MPVNKNKRPLYRVNRRPILASPNRHNGLRWTIFGAIALLILVWVVSSCFSHQDNNYDTAQTNQVTQADPEVVTPQKTTTPEQPDPATTQPKNTTLPQYHVSRVIDGDTIDIVDGGSTVRVRLIGVDTPETKDPRKGVQCFGPEASAFTTNQLSGKNVGIELDASQGDTDKYGRLLAYVYLNGANFNFTLLKEGYGREYTYNTPYKYHNNFVAAQTDAQTRKAGLWSPSACNGGL